MQFPVPQFIDVEDRIIGQFTLKQFAFIFGGGLIIVLFFRMLKLSVLFFVLSLPVAIVSIGLAFASFNGRKAYQVLPLFFQFLTSDKQYVFEQKQNQDNIDVQPISAILEKQKENAPKPAEPQESAETRLRKISLMLDQKNQEEFETVFNRKGGQ